jgi:hypothetical protein
MVSPAIQHKKSSKTVAGPTIGDRLGVDLPCLYTHLNTSPTNQIFSDNELEYVYSVSHSHYMEGNFKKAIKILIALTIFRPVNLRYLKALASAQQMDGQFLEAADNYALIMLFDPEDSEVNLRRERCLSLLTS